MDDQQLHGDTVTTPNRDCNVIHLRQNIANNHLDAVRILIKMLLCKEQGRRNSESVHWCEEHRKFIFELNIGPIL